MELEIIQFHFHEVLVLVSSCTVQPSFIITRKQELAAEDDELDKVAN